MGIKWKTVKNVMEPDIFRVMPAKADSWRFLVPNATETDGSQNLELKKHPHAQTARARVISILRTVQSVTEKRLSTALIVTVQTKCQWKISPSKIPSPSMLSAWTGTGKYHMNRKNISVNLIWLMAYLLICCRISYLRNTFLSCVASHVLRFPEWPFCWFRPPRNLW